VGGGLFAEDGKHGKSFLSGYCPVASSFPASLMDCWPFALRADWFEKSLNKPTILEYFKKFLGILRQGKVCYSHLDAVEPIILNRPSPFEFLTFFLCMA
jgi:hypothetical protein